MSSILERIDQRRFSVAEYHRMAEVGILKHDERIELIRGVICRMSRKSRAHVITTAKLHDELVRSLAGRSAVFLHAPVQLVHLDSEPEPDVLATSSPNLGDYGTEASKPVLIVEVAESSLRFDMGTKAELYAEAGVPEYWVVNLIDRELVVFRSPRDGVYRETATCRAGERVAPQAWPDVAIEAADLFLTD